MQVSSISLLKPLVGLSLLPELMESEHFEPLHTLISEAACWLLSANSGCCFLLLCLGMSCPSSCILRLRIVQTPGFWPLHPACWLLSCMGLGKSLGKGVSFKIGWNCVIGDCTAINNMEGGQRKSFCFLSGTVVLGPLLQRPEMKSWSSH